MIIFSIDTPEQFIAEQGELLVSGWVCGQKEKPLVRARLENKIFEGKSCLPRPDVGQAHPDKTWSAQSGFALMIRAAPGKHQVFFETFDATGWTVFLSTSIEFGMPDLQYSLETPADKIPYADRIRFSGWCLHPQLAIHDLDIHCNNESTRTSYGLDRPDVAAAFPSVPNAKKSGFEAEIRLLPGIYSISLRAYLEDGSQIEISNKKTVKINPRPIHQRLRAQIQTSRPLKALRFAWFAQQRFRSWYRTNRRIPGMPELTRLARLALHEFGKSYRAAGHARYTPPEKQASYDSWCCNNKLTQRDIDNLHSEIDALGNEPPLISVVMPVFNPPRKFFDEAIASINGQLAHNWELCIADDASTEAWVWPYIQKLAEQNKRIKITRRSTNGNISLASNSASALATGEFLLFFDQDDLLTADAIAEITLALVKNPQADVLYSDDDKIDENGKRFAPQFKPDWSPELLLSYMYLSHVFCVRRSLFCKISGFRHGFEGSQDYDLALRATELARRVVHLPSVLYHWRVLPGSTALSGNAKPASFEAGRRAVQEALARRGGINALVSRPQWAEKSGVGIFTHQFPDSGPHVSLLIPTKNNFSILKRCVESLEKTTYKNYELVIIDNASDDPVTLDYLRTLSSRVMTIRNPDNRFNFAHINNRAAENIASDFLLFLNDDTEISEPQWLSQMIGYAQLPGVGAVGARLLYPDSRIQHAGIIHGLYDGLAGPAFKLAPAWDFGYLSYANVARNYSAITAACMLTPRKLFLEMGGFDEENFAVAYNDVDYCYRLVDRGYRCVYAPTAELFHHEGASRGFADNPRELLAFKTRYKHRRDPYYNQNLSLEDERFEISARRTRRRSPLKRHRVLMCAFNLNWEGAPYSQFELTRELKKRGIIDPVVYSPVDGPLRKVYENAGITVHSFEHPLSGATTAETYDLAIASFAQWIQSIDCRLVYGNTLQTFYAIAAAKIAGLQAIWNIRESEPWDTYFDFLPEPLVEKALACFQNPYAIVFVANETRKGFVELNTSNNFSMIHNGLDPSRLDASKNCSKRAQIREAMGIGSHEIVVLLLGTVCERKGQHDLVRAMTFLEETTIARIRCYIVGDRRNAYSAQMRNMVESMPAERRNRINVIQETEDTAQFYAAADIFVCTSRIESYPRVILEAMAYGLPIVSTPCFGVIEQVRQGINADYYVADDPGSLATVLDNLVRDDQRRVCYANNSSVVLASLTDFDEMSAKYADIFSEALALAN